MQYFDVESGTWNPGFVGQEKHTVEVGLFRIGIQNTNNCLMGCIVLDTSYCRALVIIVWFTVALKLKKKTQS